MCAAMSGSWVTKTTVMPCSWLSRWKIAMISSLATLSRLPVGSSARMIAGSLTRARAMATRCCWPPDSSLGLWSQPVAQPDRLQRGHRPLAPLSGGQAVAVAG